MAATPAATGASSPAFGGLNGPRGVAVGPGGKMVVTQANGTFSSIVREGANRGDVVKIGRVPKNFIAPAVDINNKGEIFLLTVGGPTDGAGSLFKYTPGKGKEMVADIMAYQRRDPDPFDIEDKPRESNPYGVAALDDGSALVADAAGNDLLRVSPDGSIETVARVMPRTVKSPDLGEEGPPPGTPMPTEAVVTSVTVGPDGSYYIGELRGFPGNLGKSQIWRIEPGATDAVCNPKRPNRGECTRYADGLTAVVDLAAGLGGALYATQLSKAGWLAAESGEPGTEIGAVIRIGHDTTVRRELGKGRLVLPGGVEVGPSGAGFASTGIFGPGRVLRLR